MKIHVPNQRHSGAGRSRGRPRAMGMACLSTLMWFAVAATGRAQGPLLEITGIDLGPTQVTVRFRDTGTTATGYRLEHATSVTPPVTWAVMNDAVISPLGGGEYRGTMVRPEGELGFLRVSGMLSGGGEVASAVFQPGTLVTQEGGGLGPRLVFSKPYTGTIRYAYTGPGIADSGELLLAGATEVTIPAPKLADDEQVDGLRTFSLRLEKVVGGEVRLGDASSVVAEDNDQIWRGVFGEEGTAVFSLVILRSGAGARAILRGESTTFFPPGDTAASAFEFTANRFHVRVPGITVTDRAAPFEGVVLNELQLDAQTPNGMESWVGDTISGRYTWQTTVPGRPFLNSTETGAFHLKRQPSAAPTAKLPLTDVQP